MRGWHPLFYIMLHIYITLCFYIEFIIILKQLLDNKKKRSLNKTEEVHYNLNIYNFFFLDSRKPTFRKAHFVDPSEWVKLRLSQTLTRGTCPDSNSRFTVQISSPLPSHHATRPLRTLNIYTSTHNLLNLDVTFFRFSTRDTPSTLI